MNKEIGQKSFDVWILGDSNPKNWESDLFSPFDSRHPIRHNIITSVFDIIQEYVYLNGRLRVDSRKIYIRNAVEDAFIKPKSNDLKWSDKTNQEIRLFQFELYNYSPKFLLTFGAFSFEFARRCQNETEKAYNYWTTKQLGNEFFNRTVNFDLSKINIIPLLHRSIAGGKFLVSHNSFCNKQNANYFEEIGLTIGLIFYNNFKSLNIWCK